MTEGVVVVVQRDERFLVIRRAAHIRAGGAWCFVGGAIDPGESQTQAAAREFHEEVGGHIIPLRKIWEYSRSDGQLRLHWWLAELKEGELIANPEEVSELRWCTATELGELTGLLESNREFMRTVGAALVA